VNLREELKLISSLSTALTRYPCLPNGSLPTKVRSFLVYQSGNMGGIPGYDARNNDARTPLHRAAAAGKAKAVIEILGGLDRAGFGNFKNAQDKAGQTALHLAAENNFVEVADILLKANGSPANPHLKDNNGQTPLHLAAEKGHEAMIRLLLGSDSSPKTPDKDGRIPLHLAAYNGHERAVVALLSREDVYKTKNIRDSQGQPAIYYAVDRLHKSVAARLKGALADVEAPAAGNQTLLHQMVSTNRADAADILLGLGADMEFRDAQGRTPLYAAAEKGHRRAFDVLYEKWHANKNATESLTGRTLMHRAAAERNPHATQLLLEAKASTEERDLEGQTPLYVAAKVGDVNIARLLVAGGAAKDAQGGGESGTLLHRAAREGDARAVGVLCDVDADKEARDAKGRSPLYVAAESNQRAAVVRLVEKGADREARDPAQSNETLLHRAAREGHAAATELLIAVGAGRNAVDAEGRAPLHVAALHALDVVEKLLDAEADVDKRDAAGRTPLHVAAGRGDDALDMVKKLLSYDADPVLPDHGGRTPLHAAADTGQVNVAIELLQHPDVRANRNRADAQGRTALHVAAARDGVDIEHLLINDGLDIEARDAEGRTPLHIAAQLGRRAAVFRLLALGADRSAKDHGGNYPIMLAAECGDPELIRMLADPTEFKVASLIPPSVGCAVANLTSASPCPRPCASTSSSCTSSSATTSMASSTPTTSASSGWPKRRTSTSPAFARRGRCLGATGLAS